MKSCTASGWQAASWNRWRDAHPQRIDGFTIGSSTITGEVFHGGEMHPDGDEVLYLISGSVTVTLELEDGDCLVDLEAGDAVVVPQESPPMSTFGQINVLVNDMAATTHFYRLLELEFPDPYEWPPGSGAQHIDDIRTDDGYMAIDNPPMARIWNSQFERDRHRGNVVTGLTVATGDDVDRLYQSVKAAGHPVGQEPYDAFFGSRYAIAIDADGNQVGLKSPVDLDQKYEPDL